LSKSKIPILEAILRHLRTNRLALHVPGHKLGRGLPGEIGMWLSNGGRLDLTEIPGLDDLHAPEGAILEAQRLAARAFGAEETHFLVNGSTAGNLAMIMAAVRPGETILVPRNLHKSVLHGLVLAQARPVYLTPDTVTEFGIASGVSVETVRRAVLRHPEAKAVLVTSPTYHGICSDLCAIADVVHAAGMMLLVDEAHGAHLAFHEELPITAMQAGADAAVQSTHKMLGSLTQTAMLHVQGQRLDRVRLRKRLQLVQSTSPSYLLLASLDAARFLMESEGRERIGRALAAIRAGVQRLKERPGLRLLEQADGYPVDPFKWTIGVGALGRTGAEVYQWLHERGVTLELSDPWNVLAVFSYADGERQVERLLEALAQVEPGDETPALSAGASISFHLEQGVLPFEAFERESEAVSLMEAPGRLAAEMVIPYPPGIPLIVPGEVWTREVADFVQELRLHGTRFQGAEDATLQTVRVLKGV
jgi:arginine decarboxylase